MSFKCHKKFQKVLSISSKDYVDRRQPIDLAIRRKESQMWRNMRESPEFNIFQILNWDKSFLAISSWFDGFDWMKLEDRTMAAPLKRPIKDNIDLSNFDEYPRDRDEPPDETSGWDSYF